MLTWALAYIMNRGIIPSPILFLASMAGDVGMVVGVSYWLASGIAGHAL